ncbi:MAG TPA: UDP-2,3-diacylglucosamine hydrolase, partial [Pseudomonas sp.]|nr:UDP-2,3-diacylglucosamine hydrolase [Pseudomonas sp.]
MNTAVLLPEAQKKRVRTLWISDLHLGTRGCQADKLATFLKSVECDQLYLVGDIIDGWRLRKGIYWPQAHTNVL